MNATQTAFPGNSAAAAARSHHACPWDTTIAPVVLPELFAQAVIDHPDRKLVEFLGAAYSYADLYGEATRFAAGLRAAGIAKGDRVGLFLPNVPNYVAAYYGAMMAGAVVVNFSPLYSVEELSAQVEDSGTQLLVTLDVPALLPTAIAVLDGSRLARLVVCRLADALPPAKSLGLRMFKRGDLSAVPRRGDVSTWNAFMHDAGWTDWLSDAAGDERLMFDDIALLQYTGGTTGRPKGAMLTHANLSANARQVQKIDPFDGDTSDIILGALPLFHVFANTCVLNRTVARGGTIAMVPRFDAGQVLREIERCRPTAFPGVPTMFQALLDHPDCARTDFSSLRVCISGGAALSAPLRESFERQTNTRLVEGYGLTESAGVVSTNPYEGFRREGTIGQLLPQTRAILLDKEDPEKEAEAGEPGELAVAGPQIMRGYWNRPDAQSRTFARHHGNDWLRTGDIATIDDEGFLKIVDRAKDMIAVAGFKVFPSRVENVLVRHPDVKEALVIGVPDDYRGEMPKAFVTLNDGANASAQALEEWLNPKVGKHERVIAVVIRADLPKTMIGKLDRKALREEVLA